MNAYITEIEAALEHFLPQRDTLYKNVTEAMRYSLLNGGKRVRAQLTLAFCKLCGGDEAAAMPFACAVEMVHAYSLIHDDLPAMDNDDMRRGKPSNHKVYGEATALLAGDGLLTKAFETALSDEAIQGVGAESAARAAAVLAEYAGERGMVGGQCIDLETENRTVDVETLLAKDTGKTAALITAACVMGCIAAHAGERQLEAARSYALHIGLAFQIRDDILDVTGDAATLGKNTGIDAQNGRCTYVSLLGLEAAQESVEQHTEAACAALEAFDGDIAPLCALARRLAGRSV